MESSSGRRIAGPRNIALVGPYLSGKTTLLESILFRGGAIQRQGKDCGQIDDRRQLAPKRAPTA